MAVAVAGDADVSEDKLIDALRGCQDADQLVELQARLASNPANPPLFDWVCRLLTDRRISRVLAARVLQHLHHHPSS